MADRTVRVRLEAMIAGYEAALAKAGLSTKTLGHTVDSVAHSTERSFKSMALSAMSANKGTLAIGASVAIAGTAIAKFVHDGVESYVHLVDEVRAYKNVTGASAEESSRMVAVGRILGIENKTLATGMFRLSGQIMTNSDGLHRYGIEIAHTKDGHVDLNGTLLNVGDAWRRTDDQQKKNEITMAAFTRRAGQGMIPILKQTREQLEGFWMAAEHHGEIVSDADLKAVFEYKVAVRELGEAWTGLERKSAPGVVKALTFVADNTTRAIDGAERWAHDIGEGVDIAGDAARSLFGLGDAHKSTADKTISDAEAQQAYADSVEEAARKTDAFLKGLDALYTTSFSIDAAQGKFNADLAEFADKVRAAQLGGDAYAASLDESTRTGHANAEMVRGLTKDILDTAKAARVSGEDVSLATEMQRNALVNVLTQLGFNRDEAQKYVDTLARLDGLVVSSEVDLDISDALAKLDELESRYGTIAVGVSKPEILDEHDNAIIEAGRGVPDSIASPELLAARARQNAQANALPGSTAGAVAGGGPATQAERDRQAAEAKQRADDAARVAADRQTEADRRKATEFEFGGISADDYKRYLEQRLAQTQEFSAAWADVMHEIDRVNQKIGAGWTAAADQIRANEEEWMRVLRLQHEFGQRSTADYLAQLEKRLKGLQEYSEEWASISREIAQLKDETSQDMLNIMAAVDKQRLRDIAWFEAAPQRQLTAAREGFDYRQVAAAMANARPNSSVTYSPQLLSTGDVGRDMQTVNQRIRDHAFLSGV